MFLFWGRVIIYPESTKNGYRILKNYKYKVRTKQCLSLTRLTNKISLRSSTQCVRPSAALRTSYPLLCIAVFRQTAGTEHTVSVLLLFFCRNVSERNSKVTVRISMSVRRIWIPAKPLFCLLEGPRRTFDASRLVLGLVACLIFFFLSCPNKFSVRRSPCFIFCSTARIWLQVQVWHSADI